MADAKLTLKLNRDVIEAGKRLAREQGTSLSRLIERFLRESSAQETTSDANNTHGERPDDDYVSNRWGIKVKKEPWWGQPKIEEYPPEKSYKEIYYEEHFKKYESLD